MNLKKLWDKLAKENSKYYINSDHGKKISEEDFKISGFNDYHALIKGDSLLFKKAGGTLLEIGCGTGRMTEFIEDDFNVIGIDISGEMIKLAWERLGLNGPIFAETNGYKIPLPDNSIDVAFSYLVFQHMKERKMVESNFKEVYRVLKPGGIFKVRIRTDKVDVDRWWGGVEYTEQSIGELIQEIGYKLIRTEPVEHYGLWVWIKK